jgi:hypothetical protein
MAEYQPLLMPLIVRNREQARSHRECGGTHIKLFDGYRR